METLRRPLGPQPAGRRPRRRAGRATAAVAAVALFLAGCSDADEEPSAGPPTGEVEPLEAGVPAQWRERWCDAREAATGEEAVAMLGAPTAQEELGRQRMLTWQHEQEVSLSLVVDAQGAVVDRSSSVSSDVPAEVAADLECPSR